MSDQTADELLRALLTRRGTDAHRAGWKVALNVPGVQRRLGLSRSLAAPLFQLEVHSNGAALALPADSALHVEAELALRLKNDVTEPKTTTELCALVDSYAPCLELVDYKHPRGDLAAMFAHSFFHAGVVLGDWQSADVFEALRPDYPNAIDSGGHSYPRQPETVPDDVLEALRVLVDRVLAAGATLRGGELVICGSYIEPVPLPAGASVRVHYGLTHAPLSVSRV
jgi:2-keto-4-pentenoate hydratase